MNRKEFMSKLEQLLADIPAEERAEALQYYEDYFDDAGAENEADVIRELVSPERVAATIQRDMKSAEDEGEFTENGYQESWEQEKDVPEKRGYTYQKENHRDEKAHSGQEYHYEGKREPRSNDLLKIILIIAIGIAALSIGGPVVLVVVGAVLAVLLVVFFALAGLLLAAAVIVLIGLGLIVGGFVALGSVPAALVLWGTGLVLIAAGVIGVVLMGKICIKVYPAMFRGVVNICRKPFHRKAV